VVRQRGVSGLMADIVEDCAARKSVCQGVPSQALPRGGTIPGPGRGRGALRSAILCERLIGIKAHPRLVWQLDARAPAIAPRCGAVSQPIEKFNHNAAAPSVRCRAVPHAPITVHLGAVGLTREAPGA